ncbi:Hypothetical predicted protein [Olea europaea subsp. europaea]|uniref:Uncharacterized protein n=1 Tax=Olea europaea subsp. europaea TaxID=158383 RepID=A0A8S0PPL0_OLEEU|nr:Hypothetical predicted protein [Olea europaea subsp. europaea]
MESNHKHRGLKKAKLAASSTKVKPTPDPYNSFNANGIGGEHTAFIAKQHKVFPQQQKVTFVVPDDSNAKIDHFYDYGITADEAVDAKATSYISRVQARFRLE